MRKNFLRALVVLAALFLTMGCALAEDNAEDPVIALVNGEELLESEYASMESYYYIMYGNSGADLTDETIKAYVQDLALTAAIEDMLVEQDMRAHGRRRRLAVASRHGDDTAERFRHRAQQLHTGITGNSPFFCLRKLGIVRGNRVRIYDRIGTDDGGRIVPDAHGDARFFQFGDFFVEGNIAAAYGKPLTQKILGERAHAYPADADKMYVFSVEKGFQAHITVIL